MCCIFSGRIANFDDDELDDSPDNDDGRGKHRHDDDDDDDAEECDDADEDDEVDDDENASTLEHAPPCTSASMRASPMTRKQDRNRKDQDSVSERVPFAMRSKKNKRQQRVTDPDAYRVVIEEVDRQQACAAKLAACMEKDPKIETSIAKIGLGVVAQRQSGQRTSLLKMSIHAAAMHRADLADASERVRHGGPRPLTNCNQRSDPHYKVDSSPNRLGDGESQRGASSRCV